MAINALAILLADIVNGADIGMVQGGGRLRFALKAGQRLRISRHVVGQELQGNKTVKTGVFGLVDYSHAAAAEFFGDAVM